MVRHLAVCLGVALAFAVGRWSAGPPSADGPADVAAEVARHLRAPPAGHGEVKVPSVFRDARGSVHNLRVGGFRFNVLVTRRGCLRSGDVHKRKQLDMLFKGRVRVLTREGGRDVAREYTAGQLVVIPANVPHIFEALDDAVMAEWWEGGVFETRYYDPYRSRVDAALATAAKEAARDSAVGSTRRRLGFRRAKR